MQTIFQNDLFTVNQAVYGQFATVTRNSDGVQRSFKKDDALFVVQEVRHIREWFFQKDMDNFLCAALAGEI